MKQGTRFKTAVLLLICGWLSLFVLLPSLIVLITSFLSRDEGDFIKLFPTINNYIRLFDPLYGKLLAYSIYLALLATFFCLMVGYPFAFLVTQLSARQQKVTIFLLIIPFWTNSLIRTYGLKLFIGTEGLLNFFLLNLHFIKTPLKIMYTQAAVILGLVYVLLPFMILPIYSSIEKLDKNYLEAAKDLGASKLKIFVKIILPLTMPGVIAGSLLVFLSAVGIFYVSDLLGGAKHILIGNLIKSQFLNLRDWPLGAATSIAVISLMSILLFIYYHVTNLLENKREV